MKQEYINEINKLLNQCNDIDLLDLILKILQKSDLNHSVAESTSA